MSLGDPDASIGLWSSDGAETENDPPADPPPPTDASAPIATETPDPTPDSGTDQSCGPSQTLCDAGCVNVLADPANCGSCGHACPGNLGCDGKGFCVAPPGCTPLRRLGHDYLLCAEPKAWPVARNTCLSVGMDLVVVEDSPEADFLREHLERWAAEKPIWLGLNDLEHGGTWRWVSSGRDKSVSGENATFLNWSAGEPNGDDSVCLFAIFNPFCRPKPDEDCVAMALNGAWYDAPCSDRSAFACETTAASVPYTGTTPERSQP